MTQIKRAAIRSPFLFVRAVRDADTGLPLVGATVSLSPAEAGTITDPQGTFRFDALPVGRCWKPIDVQYSKTLKTTLYEARSHYSVKMKDYFRPDLRWEF